MSKPLVCMGRAALMSLLLSSVTPALAQRGVDMTTWHQDIPAVCTGCVYRTGQNLQESKILYSNISTSTFGQYCNAALDGQVYGEPLVVTNVTYHGQSGPKNIAYVATMNDSIYAFDASPPAPTSWPVPSCTQLDYINLPELFTAEAPPTCDNLGGTNCMTLAPTVGVLGTPVISTNTGGSTTTGTMYLVAETANSSLTYFHRLWTLDITNLQNTSNYLINPTNCFSESGQFSQLHIQRPALLLGGDNYLYVTFSMMDGNPTPLPNGVILGYNTSSLSTSPLCLPISQGISGSDGGGIWGGGGGPGYGPDANTGTNGKSYTFFNTGNGQFLQNSNYGDSFIKMYNSGSARRCPTRSFGRSGLMAASYQQNPHSHGITAVEYPFPPPNTVGCTLSMPIALPTRTCRSSTAVRTA